MVRKRVTTLYICEFCQKEYSDIKDAEICENRCRRFADSPGLEILNLSPKVFNVLYYAKIETVSELIQLSEKELLKIKGLGRVGLSEIKDKLEQYSN